MHYGVLVIVEPDSLSSIEAAVEEALAPYQDKEWDWYQIGGRWTGALDGYDPELDPANKKPCEFCEATGTTTKAVALKYPAYKEHVGKPCIQCKGEGQRVEWPTQWERHQGDIQPISSLTEEQYDKRFYAVVVDGEWFAKERFEYRPWVSETSEKYKFVPEELPPLDWLKKEYADHLVVAVDCHN
jgi:hypothetical protein